MSAFLEVCNQFLWGFPLLILLFGTHLYFTFRLKFPQKHIFHAIRLSVTPENGKKDGVNLSGFAALSTTLAATLGTGNIIGVSTAIALGGPGALFWCWIAGFFGMATSYAECFLSVAFKQKQEDGTYVGGPMYVLHHGLHKKNAAKFYAFCIIMAAFGVGCTTQANAMVKSIYHISHIPPYLSGIVISLLAGLIIIGGIRSIGKFCTRFVPFMGLLYIGFCIILLYMNREVLLDCIRLVFDSAFKPHAAFGGFIGSTLQSAARYGIARGLFTNEAGVGTTAIAAAASETTNPKRQGLISMTAVFWDTVVMCALTGLVIISSMLRYPDSTLGCNADDLTHIAFSYLPFGGITIVSLSLIAFAFTTFIGWCYFGEKATEFLFGKKGIRYYHFLYIIMIYLGSILSLELVWGLTDFVNAIMIFPNLLALYALRKMIHI